MPGSGGMMTGDMMTGGMITLDTPNGGADSLNIIEHQSW